MSSSTSSTIHQNVVPSEVGWQFVPQYYTFVNKQPNRLHCFYTKSSTFIHGTEGEEGKPCFGQQEIHQKITSIGFQDCKVFIHSVDAQASANGGIIIQVIGEMSNRGEAWRKFVQTFFLAEQPNGYFVLNDIFRFLKEEAVETDDADSVGEPEAAPSETAPTPAAAPQTPAREPSPPPAVPSPAPSFPSPTEEAPTNDVPEPAPRPPTPAPEPQPVPAASPVQPNGHTAVPEPEKPAPSPVQPAPAVDNSPASTPAPQPPAPIPIPVAAPVAAIPQPAAPAPAPAAPRSWASLAASNSKKWGSAVAQESRGTTETPASPAPSSGTQTPAAAAAAVAPPPARGPPARSEHPALQAAQAVNTPQCFIKGVVEPITQPMLSSTLMSRFGPIKDLEIVRTKACAFLEFSSVEAARRAIVASMNQSQGGDGGVFVDIGTDAPLRIFIETKKERGDRPAPRPRGGAPPVNGEGRGQGSYRGRGSGRGRGVPPPGK